MLTVQRFEAFVGLRCRQRITTATTDAKQAQTLFIDAGKLADEIGHTVNVFDAIRRFVDAARLTTAGILVRRIGRVGDVALFGQALGIQTGDLFFHAAIGVCNDHGLAQAANRLTRVMLSRHFAHFMSFSRSREGLGQGSTGTFSRLRIAVFFQQFGDLVQLCRA